MLILGRYYIQVHEAGLRVRCQLFRHSRKVDILLWLAVSVRRLTHNSYANGQSEIVMGDAIQKGGWQRSDLVISTKVGKKTPDIRTIRG